MNSQSQQHSKENKNNEALWGSKITSGSLESTLGSHKSPKQNSMERKSSNPQSGKSSEQPSTSYIREGRQNSLQNQGI